jgi:glycosyltransferase involved in cell wall biosynthesis
MKTAAIVPAYNEEPNIGAVLAVLKECRDLDEITVVNDGSTDNTAEVAKGYGVKVVDLPSNVGKGGAMKAGTLCTDAEVLLFIDADLIGLTPKHVSLLLEPIISQKAQMSVGIFDHGRVATDWAQKVTPFLSGQRAMLRSVIENIPHIESKRYGVEMAISRQANKEHLTVCKVNLENMGQIMKEEKMGLIKGLKARMRMYWEIIRSLR